LLATEAKEMAKGLMVLAARSLMTAEIHASKESVEIDALLATKA
jgi:hypothetical protein